MGILLMRLPLTGYGLRELILFPLLLVSLAVMCWYVWPDGRPWCQMMSGVLLLAVLAFFRDPPRRIPDDPGILLAPADGKITDIGEFDEKEFIQGKVQRIGIFLSVADVHINRASCAGEIGYVQAHPGKCYNALKSDMASQHNQANCVGILCPDHPAGTVMIKQITGAIARRIVCRVKPGDVLAAGDRFGMIKFGSRTELFLPVNDQAKIKVKKGDIVRAGTTILVHYDS